MKPIQTFVFTSAITALRANIMRTALTMLGIVIGIASVILIIALAQGATESITKQVSSLGSNLIIVIPGREEPGPRTVTDSLIYADALALADPKRFPQITAVSAVASRTYQVTANGQSKMTPIAGVSEGYTTVQSISMKSGSFFTNDDETSLAKVAVLGPDVVKALYGEGFDPVGQNISINSKLFRIIGVTEAKGSSGFSNPDENIYIPVTTAMKTLLGQNYLQSILLVTERPEQVDGTVEEVTQFLMDRHGITDPTLSDFFLRTAKEALSILGTVTSLLTAMLAGIASISLLVGGIGIMNIMLVTVTERTREIGLLKAIGAKRSDILKQFLVEAIVLTLLGGIIGIILGEGSAYLISKFALKIPFTIQIVPIILAVSVSSTVGIVFGLYPAQKAAKLNPIDALRYE